MEATELEKNYDEIAEWWEGNHKDSRYGVEYVERAIRRVKSKGNALDVGCGSGGQIMDTILTSGFSLTALDISEGMISIARSKHPAACFVKTDFVAWSHEGTFDLIVAWDRIFHSPRNSQRSVIEKLCSYLSPLGILIFTAGGIDSEVSGEMDGVPFEYGSLSYMEYLDIINNSVCDIVTMEEDQPEHMVFICRKKEG